MGFLYAYFASIKRKPFQKLGMVASPVHPSYKGSISEDHSLRLAQA
jgi:hypothetical protein